MPTIMRSLSVPSLPSRRVPKLPSSPTVRGPMLGRVGLVLVLLGPGLGLAQGDAGAGVTTAVPMPRPVPAASAASPGGTTSPTAPLPATDAANRVTAAATGTTTSGTEAKPAKTSSGIYRSQESSGAVRYGAIDTPGASEVTRESIRNRSVTALPLDSVTPEYRSEVADTCQTWRDRVNAWRAAREVFERENDGRVRQLSYPERSRVIGYFSTVSNYWCRAGAAEKIQNEVRLAEVRRLAAAEKAAAEKAKIVKVEKR